MDDRALSSLALVLGVLATIASGAWVVTGSSLVGVVTIAALIAVIGALLTRLARPLPDEPEPRET
jgi:hypothetical protein